MSNIFCSFITKHAKRNLRFTALVVVVCVVAIASAKAWFASASKTEPNPNFESHSQLPREQLELELVTIRSSGIQPRQITRPAGPFFLAVDNYSGVREINVSLETGAGLRIQTVPVTKNRFKWRGRLVLLPGVYVLRVNNHPDWTCRITVTAR